MKDKVSLKVQHKSGSASKVQVTVELELDVDESAFFAMLELEELKIYHQKARGLPYMESPVYMEVGVLTADKLLARVRDAHMANQAQQLVIPRTAREWELYEGRPKAEEAAVALTDVLEAELRSAVLNNDSSRGAAIYKRMVDGVMLRYADVGACDTEPRAVLRRVLTAHFGDITF